MPDAEGTRHNPTHHGLQPCPGAAQLIPRTDHTSGLLIFFTPNITCIRPASEYLCSRSDSRNLWRTDPQSWSMPTMPAKGSRNTLGGTGRVALGGANRGQCRLSRRGGGGGGAEAGLRGRWRRLGCLRNPQLLLPPPAAREIKVPGRPQYT